VVVLLGVLCGGFSAGFAVRGCWFGSVAARARLRANADR
jgi:hypothetical protein